MKLPVKISKIYKEIKAVEEYRKTGFSVVVAGHKGTGKSTLIKTFGKARFDTFIEMDSLKNYPADLLLIVIPASASQAEIKFLKEIKHDNYLVILTKTDILKDSKIIDEIIDAGVDSSSIIPVSAKKGLGVDELRRKISDMVGISRIALAYQVPSFSKEAVDAISKATAKQNALAATVLFIPGADMPVLTANQIKMILEIGAVYGVRMDWDRAKEVLAVVGAGYGFRQIARQLLNSVPGPGWIVKGLVAYSGTLAVAKAADLYFSRVVFHLEKPLA